MATDHHHRKENTARRITVNIAFACGASRTCLTIRPVSKNGGRFSKKTNNTESLYKKGGCVIKCGFANPSMMTSPGLGAKPKMTQARTRRRVKLKPKKNNLVFIFKRRPGLFLVHHGAL